MGTPVTVKIKFRSDTVEQFIEQYATDASEGGMFIRTPRPLAEGTHLTFHFQLQDGSPLLTGSGTVVWVREEGSDLEQLSPGMGVRFDSLPPEGQSIVDRLLAQKESAEHFSEDLPTRVATETMRQHQAEEQIVAQAAPPDSEAPPDLGLAATTAAAASAHGDTSETEEDRRDRLEKLLFAGQEEAEEREQIEDAGALPISHDARATEPVAVHPAPYAGAAAREQKSSTLGWVLLALMLAGGALAYYFLVLQKQQVPQESIELPKAIEGAATAPDAQIVSDTMAGISVQVKSTPANARIWLDGTYTGKTTPAELSNLDPDKEIELAFDLSGKKLVTVTQKPTLNTPIAVTLEQDAKRSIALESDPPAATVTLDGRRLGKTPLVYDKPLKAAKTYTFKLDLPGHETAATSVRADEASWERDDAGDEVLKLSVELKARPATAVTPKRPTAPRPARASAPTRRKPATKVVAKPTPPASPRPEVQTKPAPEPIPAPKPEPKPAPTPATKPEPKKPAIKLPSWGE